MTINVGFTDEHQCVGDVVITHVDGRRADPRPNALLSTLKDRVHHAKRFRSSLDSVQTLTCITKTIRDSLREQVLLRERPQAEHV